MKPHTRSAARRRADPSPPHLSSWSFSTHKQMARCPARTKYAKIDRLPDPAGEAAERGNRLHAALEQYIVSNGAYPLELLAWRPAIDLRITNGIVGADVIPEMEMAFDHRWKPTSWDAATIRAKLDLVCVVDDATVEVIDFKTGRAYDDHADQLEFYATLVLHSYDWCQEVKVANWYLDRPGEVLEAEYVLAGHADRLAKWKQAVVADMSRTNFPAQRNPFCKHCPFSSKRGGPCVEG